MFSKRHNYDTKHTGISAFIQLKISAATTKVAVYDEILQFVDALVDVLMMSHNQFIM